MSATLNIISSNIQGGYGLSETSLIPCFRMQGRSVPVSSFSGTKLKPCQTKIIYSRHSLKHTSFVCKIGSNNQRNNPDFPKHNRHIFSRNNRNNSKNNLDESEFVPTKNGSVLSISNNPRSNTVIGPGEKEREIVELFRKVQVKLREKGGAKEEEEEEKVDSSKEENKETQSVDSLINLLRKHSADQAQQKVKVKVKVNGGGGTNEFSFDRPRKFEKPKETRKPSFGRPVSSFRRQSPVPKVQFEPIVSKELTHDSNLNGSYYEPVPNFEPDSEPIVSKELTLDSNLNGSDSDPHLDIASGLDPEIVLDQETGFVGEEEDLNAMKLIELRAVAKSRGIKGISKLKKSDLIVLLTA